MKGRDLTQQEHLRAIIKAHPLVRAHELRDCGITAATISRAQTKGLIGRVSRGLYQSLESDLDSNQSLAEVAKRIPNGVICLVSALAFHGLTDQMPRKVWVAIGRNAWTPAHSYPPTQIVRFTSAYLTQSVEYHEIAGVKVPVYGMAKTLADVFRNSRLVDRSVAIEALRAALSKHRVTPSDIIEAAKAGGAYNIIRPYLEALVSNG